MLATGIEGPQLHTRAVPPQEGEPQSVRVDAIQHGTVWEVDWEGKARIIGNEHPTQKPLEIFARPMRKHTRPGAVCYEPFSGSGSQLIAAEQLRRRCFAIEIEPRFVDVAVTRWETFTGRKAQRIEAEVKETTEKTPADVVGVVRGTEGT